MELKARNHNTPVGSMRALVYWAMSGVGGVQRMYPYWVKAFEECGVKTDVLAVGPIDVGRIRVMDGVDIGGFRLIRLRDIPCGNIACSIVGNLMYSYELNSMAKDYDLVYLDTLFLTYPPRGLEDHPGLIYYLHGFIDRSRPQVPLYALKRPHRALLLALMAMNTRLNLAKRARVLLANSRFTAYVTYRSLGVLPKVLYPPIDYGLISRFRGSDREDALATFGRLGSSKGHELAIRVAKMLSDHGVKVKVYVMGALSNAADRVYATRLMKMASRLNVNLSILPNVPLTKAYEVLGRVKFYIHAKPHEPFGITVAEAMAAGAVPIVHKSGGPWHDIVKYGKYGLGFRDVEEAAKAVMQVYSEGFEKYSELASARAVKFSYENFRDKVCELVRDIGEGGKN